jgi:hypothetical protein
MTVPTPDIPKLPKTPTDPLVLTGAMRSLGFDPALVAAVVLTPTSAVAISADYPQPYVPPEGTP